MLSLAVAGLRTGRVVADRRFDQIYPRPLRSRSRSHWTPVRVAPTAARLLSEAGATTIVDVGSVAGKFYIIGALTTSATYLGVERRDHLVQATRAAATRFGVRRVRFLRASILDFDFADFDGFDHFNPFYEQVLGGLIAIDHIDTRANTNFLRPSETCCSARCEPP